VNSIRGRVAYRLAVFGSAAPEARADEGWGPREGLFLTGIPSPGRWDAAGMACENERARLEAPASQSMPRHTVECRPGQEGSRRFAILWWALRAARSALSGAAPAGLIALAPARSGLASGVATPIRSP
jgi:hypothetical protein